MKPIRDYSDGQWLLLLWAFVVFFLATGLFLGSTAVTIVAVLGVLGAGYTTFVYVRANDYTLPFLASRQSASADDDQDDDDDEYDDEYDEGPYDDQYDDAPYYDPQHSDAQSSAPVVDSFERPAQPSDASTSPDLSEGDSR